MHIRLSFLNIITITLLYTLVVDAAPSVQKRQQTGKPKVSVKDALIQTDKQLAPVQQICIAKTVEEYLKTKNSLTVLATKPNTAIFWSLDPYVDNDDVNPAKTPDKACEKAPADPKAPANPKAPASLVPRAPADPNAPAGPKAPADPEAPADAKDDDKDDPSIYDLSTDAYRRAKKKAQTCMNTFIKLNYKAHKRDSVLLIDQMLKHGFPVDKNAEEGMDEPKLWPDEVHGYWAAVSRDFALAASGIVVFIIGDRKNRNPAFNFLNSVFYQTELPSLTRPETKVTHIIAIDASDLSMKTTEIIWAQGWGNWGKHGEDQHQTPVQIFDPNELQAEQWRSKLTALRLKRKYPCTDCRKICPFCTVGCCVVKHLEDPNFQLGPCLGSSKMSEGASSVSKRDREACLLPAKTTQKGKKGNTSTKKPVTPRPGPKVKPLVKKPITSSPVAKVAKVKKPQGRKSGSTIGRAKGNGK